MRLCDQGWRRFGRSETTIHDDDDDDDDVCVVIIMLMVTVTVMLFVTMVGRVANHDRDANGGK